MSSACRCAGQGLEFCGCPEASVDSQAPQQRIAELELEVERLKRAAALLHDAVRYAEWQDKHIYPCRGAAHQNWKLTIYLPVLLSAKDKSPEAALRRALGQTKRETPATQQNLARDIQAAVIRRRIK